MPRPDHPKDWNELVHGCEAFHEGEPRDVFYRAGTYILDRSWRDAGAGDSDATADALGVLLIPWNPQYYRGHTPDFVGLSNVLKDNSAELRRFSTRTLASLDSSRDGPEVERLFSALITPLSYRTVRGNELRRAHVPTAKALHMLAPNFFPLWDQNIADGYDCYWETPSDSPSAYRRFMELVKDEIESIGAWEVIDTRARSIAGHDVGGILKVHDEWNYGHFTGEWF